MCLQVQTSLLQPVGITKGYGNVLNCLQPSHQQASAEQWPVRWKGFLVPRKVSWHCLLRWWSHLHCQFPKICSSHSTSLWLAECEQATWAWSVSWEELLRVTGQSCLTHAELALVSWGFLWCSSQVVRSDTFVLVLDCIIKSIKDCRLLQLNCNIRCLLHYQTSP